jgi:hypothetical protein
MRSSCDHLPSSSPNRAALRSAILLAVVRGYVAVLPGVRAFEVPSRDDVAHSSAPSLGEASCALPKYPLTSSSLSPRVARYGSDASFSALNCGAE